jgi:Holliday junction resolvasome RuvABC ATP-dependent DNA helicase subunit
MQKTPTSITTKPNFVNYLDNLKSTQVDYVKMADILHFSRVSFVESFLFDPRFCGYTKSMPITPPTGSSIEPNKFELWKKKHEQVVLPKSTDTINLKEQSREPEKKYVEIDVSLNHLGDVLQVIKNNPIDDKVIYNIDMRSLHNISAELEQLNKMVGMKSLKSSILDQLIYFMQDLHLSNGSSDFKHTVLYGPPGTGKTEIAKIIGTMYSKLGILQKNIFKKVTRNDLVAGYLGQTAIKTKNVIQECLGGVLFIDEAYSLANSYEDDSYSKECIDTLCEALSDHKNNLMVIIAGYENELNNSFFKANPGLESRFMWRFKTDSYNPQELKSIFEKKADEAGWTIAESDITDTWFEKRKDHFPSFGRDMEMLFSYSKIAHSRRIYGKTKEIRKCLNIKDLDRGYEMLLENRKKENLSRKTLLSMYV